MEFALRRQPSLVREALWAAAIPHWFDGEFLAALLDKKGFDKSPEYQTLLSLSFIEPYPERGYNVHERTRALLLVRLWTDHQDRYKDLSKRAYQYCTEHGTSDALWLAETYYHGLLSDTPEIIDEFNDQLDEWANLFEYNKIDILICPALEAAKSKRISERAAGWVYYQQGMVDLFFSRNKNARAALEQALAEKSDDLYLTASCIEGLGDVHYYLDEYIPARSRYEEALSLCREMDEPVWEAECIQALGDVHTQLSEYASARSRYEEALSLYRDLDDLAGEASCIYSLGNVYINLSDFDDARPHLEEALSLYREIDNRLGEANCIYFLGDIHKAFAEYDDARSRYEEALSIFREIGELLGEANCIKSLGDVHLDLSEYEEARTHYEKSLSLFREIGDRYGQANCITALGEMHLKISEYPDARSSYEEALSIYREIGNRVGEADCIQALGDVHLDLSEYEDARTRYEQALSLFRKIGDRSRQAYCLKSLGDLYFDHSEYAEARTGYEQALFLYRERNDRVGEAICLKALGESYGELDDIELAITTLKDAVAIYEDLDMPDSQADCYNSIGNIFVAKKNYPEALRAYEKALHISKAGYIYLNRVNVLLKTNQVESAIRQLNKAEKVEAEQSYASLFHGRIALRKKDPTKAIENFRQALSLQSNIGDFHLNLALGLLFDNQIVEAQQALEDGLNIPNDVNDLEDIVEELDFLVNIYGSNSSVEELRNKIKTTIHQMKNQ